jgi:hypothetical protein
VSNLEKTFKTKFYNLVSEDAAVIVKTALQYMLKKRRYEHNLSAKYMDKKKIYRLQTPSKMCPEIFNRHRLN